MNLTKDISAFLLIFLMSIISSHSYAATENQDKAITNCGYLENGKDIDGFSSTVCPQNQAIQVSTSMFGEFGALTFSQEFKDNVESLKNDQQKAQDEENQISVNISNAVVWKLALGIFWIMFVALVVWVLLAMKRGEFTDGETPAKYNVASLSYVAFAFVFLIPGIANGMSIAQNLLYLSHPIELRIEQLIMQNLMAQQQRGDLEYRKATSDERDNNYEKGTTMSQSAAVTYSMFQKAVLLKINSNLYNYRFNTLNKSNYKLYDDFKDVLVDFDATYLEFIKKNPESPSEDLFRLGGVEVYKTGNAGEALNSYLADIAYDSTYGTHYSIEKLPAEADALKRDLQIIIDERGQKKGTYQTVVNTAIAKYFYDVRSNWLKHYIVEQANNGRFDKMAYAAIQGACAENPSARISSKMYLVDRMTGTPVCLDKDWKVLGEEGKSDKSKTVVQEELKTIRTEIYENLLNINTALRAAIVDDDLEQARKDVIQKGKYELMQRYGEIADKSAFQNKNIEIYSNRPFFSIFDVTATDSYVRAEWLKEHGNYDVASYQLKINDYMKNFMNVDYSVSSSIPVADPQTLLQTNFIGNSANAVQNKNFENANTFQLESLNRSLTRAMNSSISAQTGMALYGEQLIHVGEKGIVTVLAATVVGTAADKFVNMTKSKTSKETAKVGDKGKTNAKNSGTFSFFTNFFKYVANLVIPLMSYLILIGGYFAFVAPMLAKFPFIMLSAFADFYSIILVLFIAFLMFKVIVLHTAQSVWEVCKNFMALIIVNIIVKPAILVAFIANWHITDIVMKAIFPILTNNYVDTVAQNSGVIGTALRNYAVLFITMFIFQMSTLYATLAIIKTLLKHYQQEYLFSEVILNTIDGFLLTIHFCTLGFTKVLTDIGKGMTKKNF